MYSLVMDGLKNAVPRIFKFQMTTPTFYISKLFSEWNTIHDVETVPVALNMAI